MPSATKYSVSEVHTRIPRSKGKRDCRTPARGLSEARTSGVWGAPHFRAVPTSRQDRTMSCSKA